MNIGRSTAHEAFEDVIEALLEIKEEYIYFPQSNREKRRITSAFSELTLLPNVIGCIDGTHIAIVKPRESSKEYYSRYQRHDITCQGNVTSIDAYFH